MDLSHYIKAESTAEIIKWIKSIKNQANLNELKYALLNSSIRYKRLDLVTYLLNDNCHVNKTTEREMPTNTPLHHAVMLGNLDLVEDLLKRQASLTAVNSEGNTPLHLAFIFKHEKIVDVMFAAMKQTSNYVNFKNKEGLTHLHIASTRMDATIVKNFCLKAEADVKDAVNQDSMMWAGYTALHFAAKYKSLAAVKVLLKYHAARDSKDGNGQVPLQLANDNLVEPLMIVDILSRPETDLEDNSWCDTMSPFHMACLKKDPFLVKSYIEQGINVNLTIRSKADFCPLYSPLHFAVESNCEDTVKLLLDYGADANCVNENGMTPVHLALYKDDPRSVGRTLNTSIVDCLFKELNDKLQEDRRDCNGLSYFHVACTKDDSLDDVKRFLDSGRSVNERVSLGNHKFAGFTPLHFAALYDCQKIAQLLMYRGADLNACNGGKRGTPLHVALENYDNRVACSLTEEGADVTAIRPDGEKTTLHLIVESLIQRYTHGKRLRKSSHDGRLYEIKQLALEFGVDIDAKDADGNTVLHYACLSIKRALECLTRRLLHCGADINVENRANFTPFEVALMLNEKDRGDASDYAMLYHHVMNLKALGLKVNPKNDKCCERLELRSYLYCKFDAVEFETEALARMEKQRSGEIERMRSTKLDENTSVYEFALMDEKSGVEYVNSEFLQKFEELRDAAKELPMYGYLIRLKYLKALRYQKSCSSGSPLKRPACTKRNEENSAKRQCSQ